MSEVENINPGYERLIEEGKTPPPPHQDMVAELAIMLGRNYLAVASGELRLAVPLGVALEHVPASVLSLVIRLLRNHARLVARAAAVLPSARVEAWALGEGHVFDRIGDLPELLPDGAVSFERVREVRQVLLDVLAEESPSIGAFGGDTPGEGEGRFRQEVAEEHLLRRENPSLDHPEPLVPRRATPPP